MSLTFFDGFFRMRFFFFSGFGVCFGRGDGRSGLGVGWLGRGWLGFWEGMIMFVIGGDR